LKTSVAPSQLYDILLNVAISRPVFIWGAPGIGKSALVEKFAEQIGLPCVSLLGSQLAPEDIMGVPQIINGKSVFCPPEMIARDEPYCLFLDELNACSQEVQKAFYSLIHDKRVGNYMLPEGSIIIGAGNRAQDSAIVKTMSSALINRMFHVELRPTFKDWMEWAYSNEIHPLVIEYLENRPDHLWSQPSKNEETFSTPRSWHILSDLLKEYQNFDNQVLGILAQGTVSPAHASQFQAFHKAVNGKYRLNSIIEAKESFPDAPEDRDILYFLAQSFRAQIIKELPSDKDSLRENHKTFAHRAIAMIKELSSISLEVAQIVVAKHEEGKSLPEWFMVDVIRHLPRLVEKKGR
jgi:MoxR-like ATPase